MRQNYRKGRGDPAFSCSGVQASASGAIIGASAAPGHDGVDQGARIGIGQLGADRVAKTTDVVKEGDKVWVKLMGFDERGKVRLSMKVVDQASGQEIRKDAEDAA
ncbi:hypothetical protein IGS74_05535 [Aureimonas sp. OT7]|uniref:hypothetical protein n=1 Tax=Aureimonas sp. OT7 TaxID=2816454 RepID=UPI00178721F2|nr:hypothetical protein [Aureimonas sp. OT7]QOG07681.1 hypothetical protein IGS74_05535 [Aureimonas sp. OT7]